MKLLSYWVISLIACISVFIYFGYFDVYGRATAESNLTGQFEQAIADPAVSINSENRHLTPERIVEQGFDLALDAGALTPAFEYWIGFMPREMAEAIYALNMLPALATAAESLGGLNSYELLGTINLENSETQLQLQLVYSNFSGKGWSHYARFILLETLDGWRVIDVDFRDQRAQLIDNFTSLILENSDAQELIERILGMQE
ncbi:MAG: hypothetical protein AAGD09_12460 [Cyanobacteria bacterium P01_F01_bin.56]